jgi:hypothetical protein
MAEFKQYFEEQVKALPEDHQEWLQELIEASNVITDRELFTDTNMLFQVEGVKWYEGYHIPDMFEKVYKYAPRLGLSAELLRIGEVYEDIQYDTIGEDCEYALSVTRNIEINL